MSDLVNEILKDSDSKMDKAVEVAREDFGAIRTGRAHPSMFAKIMVDYKNCGIQRSTTGLKVTANIN